MLHFGWISMNSLGAECTPLKWEYDKCFNHWFRENYLKGDTKSDPCAEIFQKYQTCVKNAMKDQGMDLTELEASILGTDKEKQTPANPKVSKDE
ncbi:unnamed protein product [Clavelina lepadiformis]|uniref:TP53-regulated inhibitor of apoptosis 1 n=1 Tax=Clavelina lepadiformis TaxID=159417 RepID=A0ABP0GT00_CLALP